MAAKARAALSALAAELDAATSKDALLRQLKVRVRWVRSGAAHSAALRRYCATACLRSSRSPWPSPPPRWARRWARSGCCATGTRCARRELRLYWLTASPATGGAPAGRLRAGRAAPHLRAGHAVRGRGGAEGVRRGGRQRQLGESSRPASRQDVYRLLIAALRRLSEPGNAASFSRAAALLATLAKARSPCSLQCAPFKI